MSLVVGTHVLHLVSLVVGVPKKAVVVTLFPTVVVGKHDDMSACCGLVVEIPT